MVAVAGQREGVFREQQDLPRDGAGLQPDVVDAAKDFIPCRLRGRRHGVGRKRSGPQQEERKDSSDSMQEVLVHRSQYK